MESIYRNTILNRMKKSSYVLMALLILCTISGCGADRSGETVLPEEETANQEQNMMPEQEEETEVSQAGEQETETGAVQSEEQEENEETDETKKPVTMAQLMGGSGNDGGGTDDQAEPLPDTVLWFNATYAPLTYSNAGNWRLVGGMEPTEDNVELAQYLLHRDWSIKDKNSALEAVEKLKKEGHRAKCRECMEQLAEMEMLNLGEEEFLQKLVDSGIEENLFRYVIAYYMYQGGEDADYIAAWDLCRVNQLYGDFYVCGYMTYEEAMDASLENAVILQQMYPSWDEMVNAYMLGYQFWKSDPCLTEDSPTLERYRYYEMLLQIEDGPYTLDWNMELKKSW